MIDQSLDGKISAGRPKSACRATLPGTRCLRQARRGAQDPRRAREGAPYGTRAGPRGWGARRGRVRGRRGGRRRPAPGAVRSPKPERSPPGSGTASRLDAGRGRGPGAEPRQGARIGCVRRGDARAGRRCCGGGRWRQRVGDGVPDASGAGSGSGSVRGPRGTGAEPRRGSGGGSPRYAGAQPRTWSLTSSAIAGSRRRKAATMSACSSAYACWRVPSQRIASDV